MRRVTAGILFAFITTLAFSQGITINAKLDSTQILIGDQVMYSLEISKPVREKIAMPFLKDSLQSGVEIVETLPLDTLFVQGEMHTLRMRYLITSFDTGTHVLPRQPFIWDHEGRTDTLFSNGALLTVSLVNIDTTQTAIKDIKAPYEAPFTWDEVIPYILWGLLIIAVIAAIVYVTWRLLHKKPIIPIAEKPKPIPHVVALQKLDALKERKLWQSNQAKKYYIELTEIIRQYIEDRFNIPAMEQVSEDTVVACRQNKEIPDDSITGLRQMLTLADLVKFAKWQPLPDENDVSMKHAYRFVESTIPVITETEEVKEDQQETQKTEEDVVRN